VSIWDLTVANICFTGFARFQTKFNVYFILYHQDGGCTCPGDVSKAFGAGADYVMLGGMLAGHTESGGEMIEQNGKKFKLFYGMSSATAMKKHAGGVAEYRYCILMIVGTIFFLYCLLFVAILIPVI